MKFIEINKNIIEIKNSLNDLTGKKTINENNKPTSFADMVKSQLSEHKIKIAEENYKIYRQKKLYYSWS